MDNDGDLNAYLVQAGSFIDTADWMENLLFGNDARSFFTSAPM